MAPGSAEVRQAVAELGDKIVRDYSRGWPEHIPLSLDYDELPVVRVAGVVDRGRTGADVVSLTRRIEDGVRQQGFLRLANRTPETTGPEPGLLLAGWVDESGRLWLELKDAVRNRVLLVAASARLGERKGVGQDTKGDRPTRRRKPPRPS